MVMEAVLATEEDMVVIKDLVVPDLDRIQDREDTLAELEVQAATGPAAVTRAATAATDKDIRDTEAVATAQTGRDLTTTLVPAIQATLAATLATKEATRVVTRPATDLVTATNTGLA